jgi:hypothetical protein
VGAGRPWRTHAVAPARRRRRRRRGHLEEAEAGAGGKHEPPGPVDALNHGAWQGANEGGERPPRVKAGAEGRPALGPAPWNRPRGAEERPGGCSGRAAAVDGCGAAAELAQQPERAVRPARRPAHARGLTLPAGGLLQKRQGPLHQLQGVAGGGWGRGSGTAGRGGR